MSVPPEQMIGTPTGPSTKNWRLTKGTDGAYYWYNANTGKVFSLEGIEVTWAITDTAKPLNRDGELNINGDPMGWGSNTLGYSKEFIEYLDLWDRDLASWDFKTIQGIHSLWTQYKDIPGADGGGGSGTPNGSTDYEAEARRIQEQVDYYISQWFPNATAAQTSEVKDIITRSTKESWDTSELLMKLRDSQTYRDYFGVNWQRVEQGMGWIDEAVIVRTRGQYRNLVKRIFGVELAANDSRLDTLILNDVSPAEWEQRMVSYEKFLENPLAKVALEAELGRTVTDEEAYLLFLGEGAVNPEIEEAYEMARLRAQPAFLAEGIRSEAEAEILKAFGITPEMAAQGYADMARGTGQTPGLSALEKLKQVEDMFSGIEPTDLPNLLGDTPYGKLFAAIFDPSDAGLQALTEIRQQMARAAANFAPKLAVARNQRGAQTGLMTPDQRPLV